MTDLMQQVKKALGELVDHETEAARLSLSTEELMAHAGSANRYRALSARLDSMVLEAAKEGE